MSNQPHNPTHDDWHDRLVDRALAEQLGGETPPDLSERILAAAGTLSSTGEVTMATAPNAHKFGLRGWVLAASLLVNFGLVAALVTSRGDKQLLVQATKPAAGETAHEVPLGESIVASQGQSAGDGIQQPAGDSNADFDSLIDQIESTVDSDSFEEKDAAEKFPDNLDLVISQTQEVVEEMSPAPADGPKPSVTRGKLALADQGAGQDHYGSSEMALGEFAGRGVDKLERLPASQQQRGESAVAYPEAKTWESLAERRTRFTDMYSYNNWSTLNDKSFRGYTWSRDARGDAIGQAGPTGGQWGFQAGRGAGWPSQGLQQQLGDGEGQESELGWQGSPDGQGIGPGASGDQYDRIVENPFVAAIGEEAISTFSIDVDTASYANVRQMLTSDHVPPPDSVRIEELVNYFQYDYEPPGVITPSPNPSPQAGGEQEEASSAPQGGEGQAGAPFAAHVETAGCPWTPEHRLVRIGIKGREVAADKRPLSNLVFLVDVSGSMQDPDKLPLVKLGLKKLAEQLGENDRVAIVVYASSEGLALPSTPGTEKETILGVLDNLQAGGSTAGGAGIQLAYQIAEGNFIQGGTNRVILCTDGDFNVGTTSTAELERLVEEKAKDTKVFLSCIGFGRGNLNDAMMEKITGIGNGNYYYADSQREAERVFARGMTGMLVTIAKDVKIQVEFNPAKVAGYRLLGYENRMLRTQDFNDDKKDAGEIGAGHTVTCLYEIVPAGAPVEAADIDELKYQHPAGLTNAAETGELLTLKMRYKQPDADVSTKLEWPVSDSGHAFGEATTDMQFASAVASFGMLLRDSQYRGNANYDAVLEIADSARGKDPQGERTEFVELIRAAKRLKPIDTPQPAEPAEQE